MTSALLLLLAASWSTPAAACSKLVFPFAAYDSPLIVEVTVRAVEDGVAEVEIHDVLQEPSPPPPRPLRVFIQEVGYGPACEPWLGEPELAVGERAFLMLAPNELSDAAPWRPYGDYAEGIRLIRGEQVLSGGAGRWAVSGSVAGFREQVAMGARALREQAQAERAREERAACEAGDGEACRIRARTLGLHDAEAATALLQEGCATGDAESCLQHGLVLIGEKVHEDYDSVPSQVADVAHHVSADCAAGDERMCRVKERALRAAARKQ